MSAEAKIAAPALESALATVRADLLNLGLANPLLNYQPMPSHGLQHLLIEPDELIQRAVLERKYLVFAPRPDSIHAEGRSSSTGGYSNGHVELNDSELDLPEQRERRFIVGVECGQQELNNRLLASYYASQTSLLEQGSVTLYLAFGFLHSQDSKHSASASHQAPLLLIPVALERTSISAGFELHYTGDEVALNYFLYEASKHNGIELPSVADASRLDLAKYFQAVEQSIHSRKGWKLDAHKAVLGFFSFSNSILYEDLDPAKWPANALLEHKTVASILSAQTIPGSDLPKATMAVDAIPSAETTFQVLNADSAQLETLLQVRQGGDLVIQGPPGTGKSQTIVNLIADAIRNEKRVLFVSDKKMALEVVEHRLKNVGLGNTVLELHSNRIGSRTLFEQLRKTLDLSSDSDTQFADAKSLGQNEQESHALRETLNRYREQIAAISARTGETPYTVYGKLHNLLTLFKTRQIPQLALADAPGWGAETVAKKRYAIEKLEAAMNKSAAQSENPFWGVPAASLSPLQREQLPVQLKDVLDALNALIDAAARFTEQIDAEPSNTIGAIEDMNALAASLIDGPTAEGIDLTALEWETKGELFTRIIEVGRQRTALIEKWSSSLAKVAWTADIVPALKIVEHIRRQWIKFSSRYEIDLAGIISAWTLVPAPGKTDQLIEIVTAVAEAQQLARQIEQASPVFEKLFGAIWNKTETDWALLAEKYAWAQSMRAQGDMTAASRILARTGTKAEKAKVRFLWVLLQGCLESYRKTCAPLCSTLGLENVDQIARVKKIDGNLRLLRGAFEQMAAHALDIIALGRYLRARNEQSAVLEEEILRVADTWPEAAAHLGDLFGYRLLSQSFDEIMRTSPALASFDVKAHKRTIEEFLQLHQRSLILARSHVAGLHIERIRKHVAWQKEFDGFKAMSERKSNLAPIREAIAQSAEAIQIIKPVFMMSPSSVATFLAPGRVQFDYVIFDEASQLRPAHVLGAIARGKQTIVVGDTHQLPPTDFFLPNTSRDETSERSALFDIENILGLFCSLGARQSWLRFHYRSQHESLIAQSNRLFYDDQLIVFPSPDRRRVNVGLVLRHLLADSLPADSQEENKNAEALAVANAVMDFAAQQLALEAEQRKSLGVAALNARHRDRILDQVEVLRKERPQFEEFFIAELEEPFFVKNLENLQGDERDVIFISMGLGPQGQFNHKLLGSIVCFGGERRVNVLFTRARKRCELFTTIKAGDITVSDSAPAGLSAFRQFLHYAEFGRITRSLQNDGASEPSFELHIAEKIQQLGYTIQRNVGIGGFCVDLAVVDPQEPERYLLGVLTDGKTYRNAKSCLDREWLRESILSKMGWNLLRLWSTAWFQDTESTEAEVVEALAQLRQL
jgi:very-short-patch-repair endonuclease